MHYFNTYLFDSKSKVLYIENKDNYYFVEFENTIFYPGGGGQPCDKGHVKNDFFYGEVIGVFKEKNNLEIKKDLKDVDNNVDNNFDKNKDDHNVNNNEEELNFNYRIIHKIKVIKGSLNLNDNVFLILDKERRLKLAKMHTAEHILFKSLEKTFDCIANIKLIKIDLDENESSLFIDLDFFDKTIDKKINWELLFKAEELANKIISEKREIIEKEYSKTDAIIMEKIRIKPERIKSEKVRVIEIKDFDFSACTGTHLSNTFEVGFILITKFNQDKKGYELRFTTDPNFLFKMTQISRQISYFLETDINNSFSIVQKLKQDYEFYKERFRQISYKALDNYKTELIRCNKNTNNINHNNYNTTNNTNNSNNDFINDNIKFIYNIVDNIEKKQLIDKCNELINQNKEKTIVCFINKIDNQKAEIMVFRTKDLNISISDLVKKSTELLNGKSGGKDNFAFGSFDLKYVDDVVDKLILNL